MTNQDITIIWNMTYGCNYNCPECFQIADKRKHPQKQIILKIIDTLTDKFNHKACVLKLTGGEIFSYPQFNEEIIPYIIKKSAFRLTATTNGSFPIDSYKHFIDQTKGRLDRISVSWHKQYVNANDFAQKMIQLRSVMNELGMENNLLKVNLILIPDLFSEIKKIITKLKLIPQIKLHYQIFRVGKYGRKFYNYSTEDQQVIKSFIKDHSPLGYNNKRHYQGKKCTAGMNYFVINPDGDVFTCHEAYEIGQNGKYSLGNLVDGTFSPKSKAFYCPFEYCTVPTVALQHVVE